MIRAQLWAQFAAAALGGLTASRLDDRPRDDDRRSLFVVSAAAYADGLLAEYEARFGALKDSEAEGS